MTIYGQGRGRGKGYTVESVGNGERESKEEESFCVYLVLCVCVCVPDEYVVYSRQPLGLKLLLPLIAAACWPGLPRKECTDQRDAARTGGRLHTVSESVWQMLRGSLSLGIPSPPRADFCAFCASACPSGPAIQMCPMGSIDRGRDEREDIRVSSRDVRLEVKKTTELRHAEMGHVGSRKIMFTLLRT